MTIKKSLLDKPSDGAIARAERGYGRKPHIQPSNNDQTNSTQNTIKIKPRPGFKSPSTVYSDEVDACENHREPLFMPGEEEAIDEHNRRIEERKKERLQRLQPNRSRQPRVKNIIEPYPSCLANIRQRIVPVPVLLLWYPLTCVGKPSIDTGQYKMPPRGKAEFERICVPPDGEELAVPGLLANTLIYIIIYACKRSAWSTNGYTFINGVLTIPSINSLRRDISGDRGYSHVEFQDDLVHALNSLMETSYRWSRFYGIKKSKAVKLPRIIDDCRFKQARSGRREISLIIEVNKDFLNLIETSESFKTKPYRKLSMEELIYCKTTYSRRLYEIVMMLTRKLLDRHILEFDYDEFADRFGLHESMRKRRSQVLKCFQDDMDNYVTPITGASFDYNGRDLYFINGDDARLLQHNDLGNKAADYRYEQTRNRGISVDNEDYVEVKLRRVDKIIDKYYPEWKKYPGYLG